MQSVTERAGHIFPLALFFAVIPAAIVAAVSWWALSDLVIHIDEEGPDGFPILDYTGFEPVRLYILAAVSLVALMVGLVFGAAARQQAIGARAGANRPWVQSIGLVAGRLHRVVGVWLGVALLFLFAWTVSLFLIVLSALLHPALLLLTIPLGLAMLFFLFLRFSLVPSAAALSPRGTSSWKAGLAAAKNRKGQLLGRSMLLFGITMAAQMVIGSMLSGISGGSTRTANLEELPIDIPIVDVLGPNMVTAIAIAAASAILSSFMAAARAAGFGFIYQDRDGPIDENLLKV